MASGLGDRGPRWSCVQVQSAARLYQSECTVQQNSPVKLPTDSAEDPSFQDALSGFALAMAINAVLPHFMISLVKHSYSPGVGTGMLFNLPLGVLLIHEQLSDRSISPVEFWRAAVLYALLLAAGAFGSLYGAHAIFVRLWK